MKDTEKRAAYDDDLLLKSNQAWIFKIGFIKINIFYLFSAALFFYILSLKYEQISNFISFYYCPLGHSKYSVSNIKLSDKNMKLINIIELERSDSKSNINLKRIAEDDEYEYYVKNN